MDCANLIPYAKRICNITWSDEDTDARITSVVENAVVSLHHKLGMPGEPTPGIFEAPGMERVLFENYCLYSWNNMPEEFEVNYRRDILTVRHRYEVEAANSETETDTV